MVRLKRQEFYVSQESKTTINSDFTKMLKSCFIFDHSDVHTLLSRRIMVFARNSDTRTGNRPVEHCCSCADEKSFKQANG